jgi:hypothetical protein
VTHEQVAAALAAPPANTRDAVRGRILARFADDVSDVDWSYVELRESGDRWGPRVRIDLPHLDHASCADVGRVVEQAQSVEELARALKRLSAARSRDPLDDFLGDLARPEHGPSQSGRVLEA